MRAWHNISIKVGPPQNRAVSKTLKHGSIAWIAAKRFLFMINEAGRDLLGREVPAYIVARRDRWRQNAERMERKGPPHLRSIRLADGSSYSMVPDFQSITLLRVLQRPRVIAFPVAVAALVSALICLLLSRYQTFPLE